MIYDEPARPWAFGPFVGRDIVSRQAEALVQRYDLLDALAAGGLPRRDLDPGMALDPRLREVLVRQLVPWVDYMPSTVVDAEKRGPAAPATGWPIPQGVRLEALCYSPWLDALRTSGGLIDGKAVFDIPASAAEFARQFHIRSGIAHNVDKQMQDGFRLTPIVVGEVAMDLRGRAAVPRLVRAQAKVECVWAKDQSTAEGTAMRLGKGLRAANIRVLPTNWAPKSAMAPSD